MARSWGRFATRLRGCPKRPFPPIPMSALWGWGGDTPLLARFPHPILVSPGLGCAWDEPLVQEPALHPWVLPGTSSSLPMSPPKSLPYKEPGKVLVGSAAEPYSRWHHRGCPDPISGRASPASLQHLQKRVRPPAPVPWWSCGGKNGAGRGEIWDGGPQNPTLDPFLQRCHPGTTRCGGFWGAGARRWPLPMVDRGPSVGS